MKKDTIAWECPSCGHRHLWKWDKGDAEEWGITLFCDKCRHEHSTEMIQIGRDVWTVNYEGKK